MSAILRAMHSSCSVVNTENSFRWDHRLQSQNLFMAFNQSGSPMVVTLGQQNNIGEKPTVILYTYYIIINRHAGMALLPDILGPF